MAFTITMPFVDQRLLRACSALPAVIICMHAQCINERIMLVISVFMVHTDSGCGVRHLRGCGRPATGALPLPQGAPAHLTARLEMALN